MIRNDELHLRKVEYFVKTADAIKDFMEQINYLKDKVEDSVQRITQYHAEMKAMIKSRKYTKEDVVAVMEKAEKSAGIMRKIYKELEPNFRNIERLINLDPCVDMQPYNLSELSVNDRELCFWLRLSDKEADKHIKKTKKGLRRLVDCCKRNIIKADKKISRKYKKLIQD